MIDIICITVVISMTILLSVKYYCPWLKYDLILLRQMSKAKRRYEEKLFRKEFIIDSFELGVKTHPDKPFIIFNDVTYTYSDVEKKANQVARAAKNIGIEKGDTVSIMLYNEPAFIWLFLGLQKLGVAVAFINVFLRSKSLAHSINCSQNKHLIIGSDQDLDAAIEEITDQVPGVTIMSMADYSSDLINSFKVIMDEMSEDEISRDIREGVEKTDLCQLIFTSGTTGLPKAANISHNKALRGSVVCTTFDFAPSDIFYVTLPLYHSAAGQLALFNIIDKGATMVLKRKFSARCFIDDCIKYDVTVIQYIGELCRYLIAQPESPSDKLHKIRVAFGNGLRLDVWKTFEERFQIPHIAEFYGATESPIGLINIFDKMGSVGRTSPFLKKIFKAELLRYDQETREPLRDRNNRCIIAKPGEVGLLVVPLVPPYVFEGYRGDDAANNKKLLKDVLVKGDVYYNSYDLFKIDQDYFLYFRDRLGDTFRWKGENVSTSEVSEILNDLDFIQDTNVYGVSIPGCEGKAGMAAISLKEGATLTNDQIKRVSRRCSQELTTYARPKFLRVQTQMSLTSTFKQRKVELIDEGYDLKKINESLYYYNTESSEYEELDQTAFKQITSGNIRF